LRISSKNNDIIIDQIGDLKKYQISQLSYYGFMFEDGLYKKYSEDITAEILKIIDYLKEELIIYSFSKEIENLVTTAIENKKKIEKIFNDAQKIKSGNLIDASFEEFNVFTNTLPRRLKSHQIKSAYHFYKLNNGANFSVPGSGKTSTVLSVYEKLKTEGKCNVLFIIGPPSCFQPWKNEFIETLGRNPESIILSGGNKASRKSEYYKSKENAYELYLSTFHTALNDYVEIVKFLSQVGIHAFLIVDEAHYMKQLGGSWASSILKIGQFVSYKGILTGTPMPKSYKDIFNLFDFLWGDNSPLLPEDKIQIEIWEKNKKDDKIINLLDLKIGALFYRVRKKDLGLIPPVFHEPIIVELNETEEIIYNYVKAKIFTLSIDDYFQNEDILHKLWKGRMMRLRQAASYPKLLLTAIEGYDEKIFEETELELKIKNYDEFEIPGKLEALTNIVLNLRERNEKILIWSNFIGTLELLKNHFTILGEKCELIYGKTPVRREDSEIISEEKTREDIRDEFVDKNSGLNILIANPAACAESISLHKTCFHAIYYDLSYNCAQYIQSLDRIHRVGGSEKNEANYYFLQYANSIDQDIKKNLEVKAQRMYKVIEMDYEIYDLDLYQENDEDDISAYKRIFERK
jgi:SNF2 family DNA or RNA helicase